MSFLRSPTVSSEL
jgi:hypothetical protein